MISLQELINRYRNGDDDMDEITAVPKHAAYGARRASNNSGAATTNDDTVVEDDTLADGDMKMFPIFIPSKGRYDNSRPGTCGLLARSRIPFVVVVEPQEANGYRAFLSRLEGYDEMIHGISILPASHQGVSYVRNYIVKHLVPATGWFWQMDDDIRCFSQAMGDRKNTPISTRTFFQRFAERMKKYPNAALFSAEYEMFSWNYGPGDVAMNSYNNIAKLFKRECMPSVVLSSSPSVDTPSLTDVSGAAVGDHVSCSGIMDDAAAPSSVQPPVGSQPGDVYRFKVREDYDIVLRMIANGYCTVRFRDLSFRVPSMSECSGGMTDYYVKQRADIREQNRLFVAAWPTVSREVLKGAGKDLRFDIKVNWAALNPSKGDPAAILNDGKDSISIESLLISDADATDAAKLREKCEQENVSLAKVSTWRKNRKDNDGAAVDKKNAKRTKEKTSNRSARKPTVKRRKRQREWSDDDEDNNEEEWDDNSEDSERSYTESESASFDSDDDDELSSTSSLPSSNESDSLPGEDDDGCFGDEFSDEETYFEVMESFYNPRKARQKERQAAKEAERKAKGNPIDVDNDEIVSKSAIELEAERREKRRLNDQKRKAERAAIAAERPAAGWAGYAMALWRDVEPEAAATIGLTHMSPALLDQRGRRLISVGTAVAFIPVMFEVKPSVMEGTIIACHDEDKTVQIAPGRKYRGVPLQTIAIDRLYFPSTGGATAPPCDLSICATQLDVMLQPPKTDGVTLDENAVVIVTKSNLKAIMNMTVDDD